jgi:multidrug efflux pump
VPGVTKVDLYGTQDEKIFVEFSHAKLATLGVTPQALFDSLAKQNNVVPAGTVQTSSQRVPLRVTGALDGVKAVAETPVESNGRVFRLGDIATVTTATSIRRALWCARKASPRSASAWSPPRAPTSWNSARTSPTRAAEFMRAVPQGINVERSPTSPKWSSTPSANSCIPSSRRWRSCCSSASSRSGWRTGIVVALSVPLVLAIVFIVMNAMSLDLHRITLGALIIALGLLVDDAIIAVEMMVVKMEQGWDRVRAASFAWESTAFPMLTGTLVTAAGFLPIGFANSAVGEYAGGIFWIVAIALVASWFVAVIFTPYIGVKLLPNITRQP